MFSGFANQWTPVVLASKLGRGPLAVTLAGEKLVLFRDQQGVAHALADRCPHRGVALSLGKVTAEGCIECPFHGWQFNGAGDNCKVPLTPDAKRERLFTASMPVREIGQIVWVFTAPVAQAPHEPELPDGLTNPAYTRTYLVRTWTAHWTRVMENMLDSPHLPWVHRSTIGRQMWKRMKPDSRMDVTWEEKPWGGRSRSTLDGHDANAYLDFYQPNMMSLNIPIPDKHFQIHALVVPIDDTHTRLIVVGSRSFARLRLLNPFFNRSNGIIADQDRAVVESSSPLEVPAAANEFSVPTDRATLQFRKFYFETLKPSVAEVAQRKLPAQERSS